MTTHLKDFAPGLCDRGLGVGEKPNQSPNQPEARPAPRLFCVPRAAERRGRESDQRDRDHQRGAGLPSQGTYVGSQGCVGGNIYLPVALFSRKWPKANKDKTIEHLLPLGMKICVPTMSRGGLAGGKRERRRGGRSRRLSSPPATQSRAFAALLQVSPIPLSLRFMKNWPSKAVGMRSLSLAQMIL